jgi:hypothetical protein
MNRSTTRLLVTLLVVMAIGLLSAAPANACATCFGAEDAAMTRGMNGGILTLLGIIGAVQVGFVGMFAGFIVRSKKLRATNDRVGSTRGGSS